VALALVLTLVHGRDAVAGGFINIVTDALVLAPTPTDYANDYVEATGVAGLGVKVKNTGPAGLTLLVRAVAPSAIATGDLLVRTLTPPGTGGITLSTYTALGPTNLTLWTSGVPQGPFIQVNLDVRIRNLWNYDDTGTTGTTNYTNTLIFTVVEP
jgi:hypothetical protein